MSINLAKDALTGNYAKPNIYLCEVDKSIICKLETTNTRVSLKFNSYSEVSFEVARIYNDLITGETKPFPFYDKIEALRLIKVDGVGYFEIQSAEINSDGIKESKSVTAYSLEYTLSQKYLEDLYNDGTIGSIDSNYIDNVYGGTLPSGTDYPHITLYNQDNKQLSLLHIILEKAYGWSVGHIDTSLQTKSRQFNVDRTSIYDFIMNDICEMFNCYVVFDTVDNKINLYAEALTQIIHVTDDNITEFKLNPIYQQVKTVSNNGYKIIIDGKENKYNPSNGILTLAKAPKSGDILEVISEDMTPWETDVLVSFDNLSQEASINYNADDIKTVLTVEYGEGQNIREVNLGLPYITDLSYYNTVEWMGKELYDVYKLYNEDCESKRKDYTDRVEERLGYAVDLDYEENRVSLSYSVARNVDSSTTTNTNNGEVYYIRTGDAPNYTYVEKTLPGEYKLGTTYYRIGSSDLTEDKIVSLRKALAHYFKEDSMEELDKLVEAKTFDFTNNNNIPFGDKSYSDSESLLHILNKHKDLGAKIKTESEDDRNPDNLYENMDIGSESAKERDTAIKNFLHEILNQFGLNMLNVVRDMYIKAQDGFIGGWNAADKINEETSDGKDEELTEDQINAIKKEIQDSAEDYPEYYPIVLILDVLDAEIGTSIYSDPPASKSTGRYEKIDPIKTKINELNDANAEIANGLILNNWFYNYYLEQYKTTYTDEDTRKLKAKESSEALLTRLNPFLREDELTLEDIVSTELDGISESLSVQNDALSAAYLELQKLSQPQLSFSMSMANIFALPEFEPIIRQFKLGNLIKVAIRPDYIKQSRLLQIDMGLDDFSDFSCEFGELTNLSTQSDIHADLLSNAASAGKQVATYSSYWTQGAETATTTDIKIQQGLLDATTKIKAIDGTQGVSIDKYGIKCQKIDPTTGAVDDKQAWFVNNSLLFTSDGWKTSRAGIGEFHVDGRDFYGVIAEAIFSGYIEGTTIAGGKLYSTNYKPGPTPKPEGTYINLETGDFEIGGKRFVYDSTDNVMYLNNVTLDWNTINSADITNINGLSDYLTQLDGRIQSYSQTNDPSNDWKTTDDKNNHIGDLWFNPSNGLTKRWTGTSWVNITDTELKTLAQSKAQIFTSKPTPPYYKGDLWVQGSNGDIMNCTTDRATGNYVASDWVKSSKYTDDTKADEAKKTGDTLVSGLGFKQTQVTGKYIITPYIEGGYLKIQNSNGSKKVIIDPNNLSGNNTIFQVYSNSKMVIGLDSNGNAIFDGNVTASTGDIGGWTIGTDKLYMSYKPTKATGALNANTEYYTTLKSNEEIAFAVGSKYSDNAREAATKIGHDGNIWAGRYEYQTGSYRYAFKVINKGSDDNDGDKSDTNVDQTGIYMRGPVYTSLALFKNNIYLENGSRIRGMNSGQTSPGTTNSQSIAYVDTTGNIHLGHSDNTGDTVIRCGANKNVEINANTIVTGFLKLSSSKILAYINNNDLILGDQNNSYSMQIRSKNSIYLACNGFTSTSSRYVFEVCQYNNTAEDNNENQKSRGTFRPSIETSKQYLSDLGSPNYKWNTVYAQNTVISSDKRSKENIENINEKYIEIFDLLQPVSYNFKERSRTHLGFISQDVESALYKLGMTATDFAGFCKDVRTEKDENGNEITAFDENGNIDYIYGLNYTEFIALNTAKIKQLEQRLNQAIDIIDKQQEIIEELKNKME